MVSIITPVLNGERFIRSNIESIAKLSVDYEHIIVDGGSTDNTLSILNEYSNITVLHQNKKNGMYGGIHQGFLEAKGDYVCWVNCDDRIFPKAFGNMYLHAKKKNIDFINSDSILHFVNERKERIIHGSKFVKFFLKNGIMPFVQPSSLYKSSLYLLDSGFDLQFKIAGDMDLFYRIAKYKHAKFGYFPEVTTVFLKYGDSLGDNNVEKYKTEIINAGIPPATIFIKVLFLLQRHFCFRYKFMR
jgi:glycosyltransferase involved in cell wall biosynthesis